MTGQRRSSRGRSPRGRRAGVARGASGVGDGGAADRRGLREGSSQDDAVDPIEQARAICLRQLAVRPRTRAELASVLRRRGIPADAAEAVLDRFSDVGMIDDAAFAEAWVTSRHHGRGLARRALGQELRRRGVDGEIIKNALQRLDPDTEVETARALVARRLRAMDGVPADVAFRRLAGMLARKGYPPAVVIPVVRQALAQRAEADYSSDVPDVDIDAITDAMENEALAAGDEERYGAGT